MDDFLERYKIHYRDEVTGMSKEAMFDNLSKGMADMLEALKNGETDIIGLGKIIDEKKQD